MYREVMCILDRQQVKNIFKATCNILRPPCSVQGMHLEVLVDRSEEVEMRSPSEFDVE